MTSAPAPPAGLTVFLVDDHAIVRSGVSAYLDMIDDITVAGEAATRLELTPKSQEMLEQWKKIDFWISDKTGYAVQQKFYQAGHDYLLVTYTNVQPRADIPDSEFQLPKGAKKQPLNKKK